MLTTKINMPCNGDQIINITDGIITNANCPETTANRPLKQPLIASRNRDSI